MSAGSGGASGPIEAATSRALADLLRLAVEPAALRDQLARALDLLVARDALPLGPRGAIYRDGGDGRALVPLVVVGAGGPPPEVPVEPAAGCCLATGVARALREGPCLASCLGPPFAGESTPAACVPLIWRERRVGLLAVELPSPLAVALASFLGAVADALAGMIERDRVEESLRASEERFELAARGSDAGIWDWDLRTDRVYYSDRWKGQLGYEAEELADTFAEWERLVHPDDREHARRTIQAYLAGATPDYELEHRLRHRDGSYRWILARGAAVRDERGVATRMVGSHHDITERRRLEETLRERDARLLAARRIQERLLPQGVPQVEGLEVRGVSEAAEAAAGDAFDLLDLPGGALGVTVADVSGHGIDAALLMATTQARLRSYVECGLDLGGSAARLNEALIRETEGDRFVTALLVRIEPGARQLRYVNAGHPPGLLLDAAGQFKARLDERALPLGILPGTRYTTAGPVDLAPGDTLLLLTDGLLEARPPGGEPFGLEGVLAVLRAHAARPAEAILAALLDAARAHAPDPQRQDDRTAVLVRITR